MQVQRISPYVAASAARPVTRVQAGGGTTLDAVAPPLTPPLTPASDPTLYEMSRMLGNDVDLAALNKWGLASPGMLRFAAGGGFRRTIASWLTGIPQARLIVYGQMADLMRVNGMQADYAHLLVLSGVHSPAELSRFAGNDVAAQIQRGIIMATVAARAIQEASNTGRSYAVPSFSDLGTLSGNSIGLGQAINLGQNSPPPTP